MTSPPPNADLGRRVETVLNAAVAEQRIVGAVAVIARRGEIVYRGAVGLADREASRPMTVATPFRLASLTKPFVAAAVLALVERGTLALHQPVTRWLPDFQPRLTNQRPAISIEQLMTHTSGLGYGFLEPADGPYHLARVSDGLDQPGLSLAENLRRVASVPLRAMPGTAFNYSLSMDVLGAVLERAADAPLPDVIARFVTGPLKLTGLDFAPRRPDELAAAYCDGHPPQLIRSGKPVPLYGGPLAVTFSIERVFDPASYPSGGAGMVGTAEPFLRFLEALRTRTLPTVSAARIDAMLSDRIAPLTSEMLGEGVGYGYGASVLRDPVAAGSSLGRGAIRWGGAYGHAWFIDPTSGTSSVVLTNTAFEGMNGALRDQVERAVML